jgi:hypothetical protein
VNCRSEGGIQTAAYEFTRCDNVHLIHFANEGKQENPAVFLCKDCNGLLVDSLKSRPPTRCTRDPDLPTRGL